MSASADDARLTVYARADGCETPPQLLTPEPDWPVAVFSRIALSALRADRTVARAPFIRRTGEPLPADQTLDSISLRPYDVVDFRVSGDG